jgi:hypothetical protein
VNPYAPPKTVVEERVFSGNDDRERDALLKTEGNVRALGLLCFARSAIVLWQLSQRVLSSRVAALVALELAMFSAAYAVAGWRIRALDRRGAWVYAVVAVLGAAGATFRFRNAPGSGVGFTAGVAIALYVAWYLLKGSGARVLTPDYRALVERTPTFPLTTARWGYLLVAFLVLYHVATVIIPAR